MIKTADHALSWSAWKAARCVHQPVYRRSEWCVVEFILAAHRRCMDNTYTTIPVCEALIERNPHVSRVQAAALTMEGLVRVNGYPARHPHQRVRPTDEVTIDGYRSPVMSVAR